MLLKEENTRKESLLQVARQMMVAARTAPKSKGIDVLQIVVVQGQELIELSREMHRLAEKRQLMFFHRDGDNILKAEALVLIGAEIRTIGLNCARCGFSDCEEKIKNETVPCAFNTIDLGIAVGSAVSVAADNRVDSRIMFSVGEAAINLNYLPNAQEVLGIPISCSGKNPFFDRVSTHNTTK